MSLLLLYRPRRVEDQAKIDAYRKTRPTRHEWLGIALKADDSHDLEKWVGYR